ncbi:MAG: CapA family protein [Myxococcota bacterium]|nr:CapA family protein [Myxococcota bacterium]
MRGMITIGLLLSGAAQAGALEDGIAALQAGAHAEARTLLRAAAAEDPTSADAWWELGWAEWVLSDYAAAGAAWENVKALDPERAELEHWLRVATTRQLLGAVDTSGAAVPVEPVGKGLTLAAAGDTMMGSDLRKGSAGLAPGNGEVLFADVADIFAAADVAFLNLEGTLSDDLPQTKCGPASSSCYSFRTPVRYTAALQSASIDVVSNANNHAMDLGEAGMDATLAALDAAGIAHTARYGDIAMLERDGLKIAVVGAHSGSCCLNVNRIEEVQGAIVQADATADLVIFTFHGGAEGSGARHVPGRTEIAWGERRGDVEALSRAAVDAGADLVIGHGPHVLRAMEVYRGRLIAYSLGNFVGFRQFGTRGGHGGTSLILETELAGNGVLIAARLHPVMLDGEGKPRRDPEGAAFASIQELSDADYPDSGVTVGLDGTLSW